MEITLIMKRNNNDTNKILLDIRKALILAVYKEDISLVEDVLHVIDEEGKFSDSWEEILEDLSGKRSDPDDYEEDSQ